MLEDGEDRFPDEIMGMDHSACEATIEALRDDLREAQAKLTSQEPRPGRKAACKSCRGNEVRIERLTESRDELAAEVTALEADKERLR